MNPAVPSAAMRPTVSSASPQISSVGTRVDPTGACPVPRARYHPIAAAIAARLPITERCFSIAASGTPLRRSRARTH